MSDDVSQIGSEGATGQIPDEAEQWRRFQEVLGGSPEVLASDANVVWYFYWEQVLLLALYARHLVGSKAVTKNKKTSWALFSSDEISEGVTSRLVLLDLVERKLPHITERTASDLPAVEYIERLLESGVSSSTLLERVKNELSTGCGEQLERLCVEQKIMFVSMKENVIYSYRMLRAVLGGFIPLCQDLLRCHPKRLLELSAISVLQKHVRRSRAPYHAARVRVEAEPKVGPVDDVPCLAPRGNGLTLDEAGMGDADNTLAGLLEQIEQKNLKPKALLNEIKAWLMECLKSECLSVINRHFSHQSSWVESRGNDGGGAQIFSKPLILSGSSQNGLLNLTIDAKALATYLQVGQVHKVKQSFFDVLKQHACLELGINVHPEQRSPSEDLEVWYGAASVLELHKHKKKLRRYISGILYYDIYSGSPCSNSVYPNIYTRDDRGAHYFINKISTRAAAEVATNIIRYSLYYTHPIGTLSLSTLQFCTSVDDLLSLGAWPNKNGKQNNGKKATVAGRDAHLDADFKLEGADGKQTRPTPAVLCEEMADWADRHGLDESGTIHNRFKRLFHEIVTDISKIGSSLDSQRRHSMDLNFPIDASIPLPLWAYKRLDEVSSTQQGIHAPTNRDVGNE